MPLNDDDDHANTRFGYDRRDEDDQDEDEKRLYEISSATTTASPRRRRGYRCCSLGRITRLRWRSWFFLFVMGLLVFVLYTANEDVIPVIQDLTGVTPKLPLQPKFSLHVLLPTTGRNVNLCKSLITSLSLYFPPPVLLNWGKQFNDSNHLDQGARLARIPATLDYLRTLPSEEGEVMVLVTDSEDTWFQLDPDTLLARYHRINVEAERRIKRQLGAQAVEAGMVRQTVLFGASKVCFPDDVNRMACSAIPPSPLPRDLYGNLTDMRGAMDDFSRVLPRYLSSSFILGPVRDMLPLFERAVAKIAQGESEQGSDHEIFGSIFGEQEYYRQHMRDLHASKYMKLKDYASKWLDPDKLDAALAAVASEERNRTLEQFANESFEYGIGLDYLSELSVNTAHAESDTHFLTYGTLGTEDKAKIMAEMPCTPRPQAFELPEDLVRVKPPIDWPEDGRQTPTKWSDVPLLTNVCTGRVPVTIHQSSSSGASLRLSGGGDGDGDGNDDRPNLFALVADEVQWNKLWLQPRLRRILEHRRQLAAQASSSARVGTVSFAPPGASAADDDDGTLKANIHGAAEEEHEGGKTGEFKSPGFDELGKITAAWIQRGTQGKLDKLEWWDVCEGQGFEDELFGN